MALHYYPIALKIKKKTAVVVGGGPVSERKIKTLLKAGASVRVISPDLTPELKRLARAHRIVWLNKKVQAADLPSEGIVIAATSEANVNRKVRAWASKRRLIVNVVDQPSLSDFISPALLYTPRAIVAVYTEGKDPALSRDLKNFIREYWNVFLSYRNRL